ncbi:transcriptional regulator, DeoR family [Sporobacter termitidis DSM 10068]|uniref:Transcriptional regulator, DeoR family n=1 Tax=Sporobacter termitidis DSM 10068 TaxID=1123282 RepID=A0A1M5ZDL9_9FIRM|nr:DeoR/GlpR family DNA-binding transcription regulator [Sporobacter termitidis]SHI22274.1 transcriptional regulator, DeoR family [Sporobacter termitidis DSM 10068]
MLTQERHEKIIKILREEKSVKVSELAEMFGVSIVTIRRDLDYLNKEGRLTKVYGGAILEHVVAQEKKYTVRAAANLELKKEIAQIACQFVEEGQSIALDTSTTNLEIAKMLKKNFDHLTIITNAIDIALELRDKDRFSIILTGGTLRGDELCLLGGLAEEFLNKFHIDKVFASVSGISVSDGFTDYGLGEYHVKMKMIERAREVIIPADSSKFDVISLLKMGDLDLCDFIITDSKLDKNILQKYLDNQVKIVNKSF